MAGQKDFPQISRVQRSKDEARSYYDRISVVYDWLGGFFERKPAKKALRYLKIIGGETVLEIGFGTGHCLHQIALLVGESGQVCGIDISAGMLRVARERLVKAAMLDRVELCQGDASNLPFKASTFDAVFASFTLELIDTPEIPQVLKEVRRVLKPNGRLGVVSLSKTEGKSLSLGIYEWMHRRWPKYIDCRPIYLENIISKSGYTIQKGENSKLLVLPIEIVVAIKEGEGLNGY